MHYSGATVHEQMLHQHVMVMCQSSLTAGLVLGVPQWAAQTQAGLPLVLPWGLRASAMTDPVIALLRKALD